MPNKASRSDFEIRAELGFRSVSTQTLSHRKDGESMNFVMPSTFPEDAFKEFGKLARGFFPPILSDQNLEDSDQKLGHFQGAWLAVHYRYRACSELNEAFKTLFSNAMASDLWREWSEGEEHHYQLEQCIYHFFMNALSVFESLAFCLYFVGGMISKKHFTQIKNPRNITLKATISAFEDAFPQLSLTGHLRELSEDTDFGKVDEIRNILAHRLIGRRNVRSYGTTDSNGKYTQTREEVWHIPGSTEELVFDEELIQRHFDEVTRMSTTLISASIEFVKSETG